MSQAQHNYDEEIGDETDSTFDSIRQSEHTRLNPTSRIGVIHSFPDALQTLIKKTVLVMLFQALFTILSVFAGYYLLSFVFFAVLMIGLWGILSFRKIPTMVYVFSSALMAGLWSASTCYVIKNDYECHGCILSSLIISLLFYLGLHYSYTLLNIIRIRETFPHMRQVSKEFIMMSSTIPQGHF